MKIKLLLLFTLITLTSAIMIDKSFADKQVKINFGQTIQVDDLELYFYDIEDSRCPSDVTCIWEGQVTAMIRIENQTHKNVGHFTPGYAFTNITPYKITLTDVNPYPISTKKPDYVATLVISDLHEKSLCEENMIYENGLCVGCRSNSC